MIKLKIKELKNYDAQVNKAIVRQKLLSCSFVSLFSYYMFINKRNPLLITLAKEDICRV